MSAPLHRARETASLPDGERLARALIDTDTIDARLAATRCIRAALRGRDIPSGDKCGDERSDDRFDTDGIDHDPVGPEEEHHEGSESAHEEGGFVLDSI